MVNVEPVTKRQDLRDFLDLPPKIYAGLPGFEPPLRADRDLLLNPRNHVPGGAAGVRYWLARIDSRPVGRISAQLAPHQPRGIDPNWGMFGCLDAIDDGQVVAALLDAAREWLRVQGCTGLFGPCTLSMNDEPGLLVEGADQPPMTLSPWHPPYLGRLLEGAKLVKIHDLHNWRLDLADLPPAAREGNLRLADRIPNLRIRSADRRNFAKEIQTLCDIYNDGWQDNWGFVPLTPADLAGLDHLLKWLLPPQAFRIVEVNQQPVAVILLIPNLFELTKGLAPSPGLLGWLKILLGAWRGRFRSGRIIVTGIARQLQGTVKGAAIASLLVDELIAGHAVLKGEWVEAGWVLEDNHALIQILERFHFRRNKVFRLYSQALQPQALFN